MSLMTAELSTMLSDNGGYVLWVSAGLGDFAAWIAALNGVISSIVDLGIYPALLAEYLTAALHWHDGDFTIIIIRLVVVVVGVYANTRGLEDISQFTGTVGVCVFIPFAISFVYHLVTGGLIAGGDAWRTATPARDTVHWAGFVSVMLWSYSGWDALGSLAGEIKHPEKTYLRGTLITLAAVTVTYIIPTFVSVQTHPNLSEWADASAFSEFVGTDVSSVLGTFSVITSLAAQMAMFVTGLSTSARTVWALAGGSSPSSESSPAAAAAELNVSHLPRLLAAEGRVGSGPVAPLASLVLHALVLGCLCVFPADVLVEAGMVLTSVRLLMEVLAFLRLRANRPDAHRPYRVPGNPYVVMSPLLLVTAFLLINSEAHVLGLAVLVNLLGCATFAGRVVWDRWTTGVWWPRGVWNLAVDAEAPSVKLRKRRSVGNIVDGSLKASAKAESSPGPANGMSPPRSATRKDAVHGRRHNPR